MAVTGKRNDTYEYATTRLYSYSRSSTALAESVSPVRKETAPKTKTEEKTKQKTAPQTKAKPKLQVKKAAAVIGAAALAVSLSVLITTRYSAISSSCVALSKMQSQINSIKQEIEMLDIKLSTSVSLEAAREAAVNAGMDYPTEEQIVDLSEGGY